MSKVTDREAQQVIDKLTRRLSGAKSSIDAIVKEVATATSTSSVYWRGVDSRLRAAYAEARGVIKSWAATEIPKEYEKKLAATIRKLKSRVFETPNPTNFNALRDTQGVKQNIAAILRETLASFDVGIRSGEKTLFRLTSATQQTLLSEKRVNDAVAEGFFEKGSGSAAKRRLRDELLKKALDGKYVTVVDKNGVTRQYDVDVYAELVARTKLTEVSTQAVLNTAEVVGADLVQVSVHNTKCVECAEFEGKIFSVSGSDPDFPDLEEEPPYHPNCQHTLTITFREGLERDGTLEDYVAFSSGETEEHPTRAGWVPVSKRKLA